MNLNFIFSKFGIKGVVIAILIPFLIFIYSIFSFEGEKEVNCDYQKGTCTYIGFSLNDGILNIITNGKHEKNKLKNVKNNFLISDISAIKCGIKTEYVNKGKRHSSRRHHRSHRYGKEKVTKYIAQIETYNRKTYKLKVCSSEQECFNITNKVAENIKNGYKIIYSSNHKY